MSNRVSVAIIAGLSVFCIGLLMNNSQKTVEGAMTFDAHLNCPGGVSVSSNEQKNFVANEYVTTFRIVQRDKDKDVAYNRLNESRVQILSLLKKHSVEFNEYEFLSTSLDKEWDYNDGKRNFKGFVATQEVKAVFRSKLDSDSLELDLVGLAFVDDMRTLARLKNADSLEVAIIQKACEKAMKLAREYAQSVDAKVGRVVSVDGSSSQEMMSLSDSVEVSASVDSRFSLEGSENSEKALVHVSQKEVKNFAADKFVMAVEMSFVGVKKESLFKQIAQKRNDVILLARNLGVAESEIEVQSVNLRKRYDWEFENNELRTNAFRASQRVLVDFTSKVAAAAYLDGLAGFENIMIGAVQPVLKNEDSLRVQVTNIVGKKAMARAKAIAEGFGGTLGKVISVSNEPKFEYGRTILGGGVLRKARNNVSFEGVDVKGTSADLSMNIADSVSVSAYLEVTAEID